MVLERELRVSIGARDKTNLTEWFKSSVLPGTSPSMIDVSRFLYDVGLPPQTIQRPKPANKQVPTKILTEENLQECQSLINMISQDLYTN